MAIINRPNTKHTDISGDQLTVASLPLNEAVGLYTYSDVWLSEQQVKNLIDDLAARIGYRAILSPDAVAGWTSVQVPPEGTPSI